MRYTVLFLVLAGSVACGGDDETSLPSYQSFDDACDATPGCREPRVSRSDAEEMIWRVLVLRTANGEVQVDRVDAVMVEEGLGVPLGRRRGSHLVSLLDDGGASLDSQLISFPSSLEFEARDDVTMRADTVSLEGEEVSTVVYLRALTTGATIVVEQPDGTAIATANLADLSSKADSGSAGGIGRREQPLTLPSSACPHVALLEGVEDFDWIPEAQRSKFDIVEPGPVQRATVQAAFGLMPRLLCHGVSRIAFGKFTERPNLGGVVSIRSGDFVMLNDIPFSEEVVSTDETYRMRLLQTVVHESTHAAEILLNDEGMNGASFAGSWSGESRNIALDTIDNVRLEKSMRSEWLRMHDSFISLGWAKPHSYDIFVFRSVDAANEELSAFSPEETASAGFMSRYGGKYYADDIAEMVTWPIVAPIVRQTGIPIQNNFHEDSACQRARAYMEGNVPSRYAAIFAKLNFVRDVGMILDEDYEDCVGDGLRLRAEMPGMHFWEGEEYKRTFGQGVTAQIGSLDGRTVFEMKAQGEASFGDGTYPASARLVVDLAPADTNIELVSWPRGVYALAPQQPHAFEVRLDGAAAGNFDVIDGFVLVAESSNEVIAGSVFVRVGFRAQAPIPVPQTFDPPLTVQFRIEK